MSTTNIHDLSKKTNDVARQGVRELADKKDKAVDFVSETGKSISDTAATLASSADARLKDYGIDAQAIGETAREKGSQLQAAVVKEIRANPIRSVAVAAGIGFVLALFARS